MSLHKFPPKSPLSVSHSIIIHVGEGHQRYVTDVVPLMYSRQWVIQIQPQRRAKYQGYHVSVRAREEGRETCYTHNTFLHITHTSTHPPPDTHKYPASFTSHTHPPIRPPTHTYTQHPSHHTHIHPSTPQHTHTPRILHITHTPTHPPPNTHIHPAYFTSHTSTP